MILNLGCGINRIRYDGKKLPCDTIHIDRISEVKPSIVWDLNIGLPPELNGVSIADEIHAYHIIEHIGRMGETDAWFQFWRDCWRVLKPGGMMYTIAPHWSHMDSIGDPSHTRLISAQTFFFLDRSYYVVEKECLGSNMTQFGINFDMEIINLEEWPDGNKNPRVIFAQLRARKTVDNKLVPLTELKKEIAT